MLNYTNRCVESDSTVHYARRNDTEIVDEKIVRVYFNSKMNLNLLLTSASQYRAYREHGWPDHIPLCVIEWGGGV